MKTKSHLILAATFCLAVFMSGCKTQKNTAANHEQDRLQGAIHVINSKLHTLDTRCKVQTGSLPIKGRLRAIEDSCVWISAQFLGMEAGRALLTNNGVKVIYRLQKQCFQKENDVIFPVVLSCLQGIVLHKVFIPGKKEALLSDFIVVKQEQGGWQLIRHESYGDLSFSLNGDLQLVESRFKSKNHEYSIIYGAFEDSIPTHIAATAYPDNNTLSIDLYEIDKDTVPAVAFTMPEGYACVSFDNILKRLGL